MTLTISQADRDFRAIFEACNFPPVNFDHRAHVRLAYVYLNGNDTDTAYGLMRDALNAYLQHLGVDPSKYHDTITRAWVMAVRHFMEHTSHAVSADTFIEQHPSLLDSKIMLSHYSAELLFSDEARANFVTPDLEPIPRHD